jgi:hypothetical protein
MKLLMVAMIGLLAGTFAMAFGSEAQAVRAKCNTLSTVAACTKCAETRGFRPERARQYCGAQ